MGRFGPEDGPCGPFRSEPCRLIIVSPMPLRQEIVDLLRMPEDGAGAPTLDTIDSTLTDGYAEALSLEAGSFSAVQDSYSLLDREAEEEVLPLCDAVAELLVGNSLSRSTRPTAIFACTATSLA